MRVLVACERSGRVRDAFIRRGHYAIRADLAEVDLFGPAHQGDVFELIESERWDLMVAFPPCDHLAYVGAKWFSAKMADGRMDCAAEFFMRLATAPIPRIAIENPRGVMSKRWRQPDQVIQPWQFGEPWTKATCLWLKNLPLLTPTNAVEPTGRWVQSGAGAGYGAHRSSERRSLTFQGIADAMAEQWSNDITAAPDYVEACDTCRWDVHRCPCCNAVIGHHKAEGV